MPDMGLRVMIADDDALARALIEAIVERDGELELVASAENASRAIELATKQDRVGPASLAREPPALAGPARASGRPR